MIEVDYIINDTYTVGQYAYCPIRQRKVIQIFSNYSTKHPRVRISLGHELGHAILEPLIGTQETLIKGNNTYINIRGKWIKDNKRIIYWAIEILCYLLSPLGFLPIFKIHKY